MATVKGGQHVASSTDVHSQIAAAVAANATGEATTAGGQYLPLPAGLAAFDTVGGDTTSGFDTVGAHDTVASTGDTVASFDTVTGQGHDPISFAGESGGVEKVVATQTVHDGGVTVHFADGSSLTVAGATHVDGSFFHH